MRRTALIVDDHPGFRSEARQLLVDDGFDVVGEARDASDALRQAARLQPDVVVLDIGLPDLSGLEIVGRLRATSVGSLVVLVSGRPEADYGGHVAASGADAFVEKMALSPGVLGALASRERPR